MVVDLLADVAVDDPIHEIETYEANWKDNARVFVDIAWGEAADSDICLARLLGGRLAYHNGARV